MSFALTFGSFGDFVSVIHLLRQVQQALGDARGSFVQYQGLVDRIGAFQLLLLPAGQLQLRDISPALKNALNLHVSQAEEATQAFSSASGVIMQVYRQEALGGGFWILGGR